MWILFQLTRNGWFYWSLNRLGKTAFHSAKWGQLRKKSEVHNLGKVQSKTISLTFQTTEKWECSDVSEAEGPVTGKEIRILTFLLIEKENHLRLILKSDTLAIQNVVVFIAFSLISILITDQITVK